MSKHMPGPWTVPQPMIMNAGIPFSPVSATTLIAKVYSTAFGDHEESIANANLIASAPELLDALEQVLSASLSYQLREDDSAVELARAAIAKATGAKE